MRRYILAIWLLFGASLPGLADDHAKIFKGAFFDVSIPLDFVAQPGLDSFSADGVDSAQFDAPDGSVSFYVFAPQWGGDPEDIALNDEREALVSEQTKQANGVSHRWWTITAKDGSYTRSYHQVTENEGTTSQVIGVRYADLMALNRYRDAYAAFKKSLTRFGDN